jgi:hypothetical protein
MTGNGSASSQSGVYLSGSANDGTKVYGFDILGNDPYVATSSAHQSATQSSMGVALYGNVRDIEMADLWVHDVWGDAIYRNASAAYPTSGGYWVHHCLLERTGRQGVTWNIGVPGSVNAFGWKIEWNIIRDIALYPLDAEDSRTTGNYLDTVYIDDNDVYKYNWQGVIGNSFRCHAVSNNYNSSEIGYVRNVYIRRNRFGNDSEAVGTAAGACMGFAGEVGPSTPPPDPASQTIFSNDTAPKSNWVITDNTWDVPSAQTDQPWLALRSVNGLIVTGNDVPNPTKYTLTSCTDVTFSGNT